MGIVSGTANSTKATENIPITAVAVLFRISKALAGFLDIPLTLHASLAPRPTQRARRTPGMHKGDNEPPELSLAATVVICLKMVYGELSGKEA